jgi:acetylornithine/N-succinyldiaminopimelate aminotransferase
MLALIMDSPKSAQQLVKQALQNGVLLFFLLFEPKAVRISPPLTLTKKQLKNACKTILQVLDRLDC